MTDNALTTYNPTITWGNTPPPATIQDGLSDALAKTIGAAMDSIFPAFRALSFANNAFHIRDGKSKQTLLNDKGSPQQNLSLVVLNVAPASFCSWWEDGYTPGSNTPPTAVWIQDGPLPPNVPDWVINTKKEERGKLFKHYSVKRRAVVALVGRSQDGKSVVVETETPYVVDIGESSMFMPDAPPLYSFLGFLKLCQSYNTFPFSMLIQLQFDYTGKGAPNTIRFSPFAPDGNIKFFDKALFDRLRQVAASSEVTRLLELNTNSSNNYGEDVVDVSDAAQAPPAQKAPPQAAPKATKPASKPVTKPAGVAVAQPMSAETEDLLARAAAAVVQPQAPPVVDSYENVQSAEANIIDVEDDAQAVLAANMDALLGTL